MSNITLEELAPLVSREAKSRAGTLLAIFCLVSLAFLLAAFFWQKKYSSSVLLYVDDSSIASPIIGAGLVASSDKASVVREELFALDILDRILDEVGSTNASTPPAQREEARENLTGNTTVYDRNNQLLEIEYDDEDPVTALKVTSLYAELFLRKTMDSSTVSRDSSTETRGSPTEKTREAFKFVINPVEAYSNKLENAPHNMTLGAQNQGAMYRIHQPANFLARRDGLRFEHIVLAGIVLASVLPFVYLLVFLKVDPRIRTASAVSDMLQLPLLTVVPHLTYIRGKPPFFHRPGAIMTTVGVMCALYVAVFVIKSSLEAVGGGTL